MSSMIWFTSTERERADDGVVAVLGGTTDSLTLVSVRALALAGADGDSRRGGGAGESAASSSITISISGPPAPPLPLPFPLAPVSTRKLSIWARFPVAGTTTVTGCGASTMPLYQMSGRPPRGKGAAAAITVISGSKGRTAGGVSRFRRHHRKAITAVSATMTTARMGPTIAPTLTCLCESVDVATSEGEGPDVVGGADTPDDAGLPVLSVSLKTQNRERTHEARRSVELGL